MKRFSALIATLALLLVAAPPVNAEEASAEGALMNATCPFTGKATSAEQYVDYADDDAGVYARIYFCCENCQGKAAEMDSAALKPRYIKAYLADSGAAYGEAALVVENETCPVSGEAADGSQSFVYNAAQINICCPGCDKKIAEDPATYLPKISDAIDAAQAKQGEEG